MNDLLLESYKLALASRSVFQRILNDSHFGAPSLADLGEAQARLELCEIHIQKLEKTLGIKVDLSDILV